MKRWIIFYILFILMLGSIGTKAFALPSESFGSPRTPLHYVSYFSDVVKNDYSSRWNSGDIREMGSVVGEGLITLLTAGVKYADNAGRLGKTGAFIQKITNLKRLRKVKNGSTVYRGVRSTHPGYKNATQGIANPRRSIFGHKNPALHNAGNTKSKFTSWTTDRNIAKRFSGNDGVILETTVPKSRLIFTPDKFQEKERLILGPVRNAKVTRP